MMASAMILVTHLLGSGHLSRALTIARAFAAEGHAAHVVSGGFPVPQLDTTGVSLHQLPPLRSDGTDFSRLVTLPGFLATAEDHAIRQRMLVTVLREVMPDILITELFPFGRRSLRDEFRIVLEAARDMRRPPRIFASVRDILAPPSKPAKVAFAEEMIANRYDAVLVHSDPTILPLESSWPVSPALSNRLRYTGFVAPALPQIATNDGRGEILVSAGGGSVGDPVFAAAVKAAALSSLTWRILVGGQDAPARIAQLTPHSPPNVILEPARADFRAMLRHASASVSLCGYNTAMDILQTGIPAVVVPFDEGSEVEQGLRARELSHLPGFEVVSICGLHGRSLHAAIERARIDPRRDSAGFRFDGARETVRICMEFRA